MELEYQVYFTGLQMPVHQTAVCVHIWRWPCFCHQLEEEHRHVDSAMLAAAVDQVRVGDGRRPQPSRPHFFIKLDGFIQHLGTSVSANHRVEADHVRRRDFVEQICGLAEMSFPYEARQKDVVDAGIGQYAISGHQMEDLQSGIDCLMLAEAVDQDAMDNEIRVEIFLKHLKEHRLGLFWFPQFAQPAEQRSEGDRIRGLTIGCQHSAQGQGLLIW